MRGTRRGIVSVGPPAAGGRHASRLAETAPGCVVLARVGGAVRIWCTIGMMRRRCRYRRLDRADEPGYCRGRPAADPGRRDESGRVRLIEAELSYRRIVEVLRQGPSGRVDTMTAEQ